MKPRQDHKPDDLNPDEVRHLETLRRKEERGRPFKILANFIGVVFLILTIIGFGFVALMITIIYEG